MNLTKAIQLQAFLNILRQEDSLPPELVLGLNRIGSQLESDPIAAISELVKLTKKPPLKERYVEERDRLDPDADPNSSEAEKNRGPGRVGSSSQTHPDYLDNVTVGSPEQTNQSEEQPEEPDEEIVNFFQKLRAIAVKILSAPDPVAEAERKKEDLDATEAYLCSRLM